jgi:hypothetical protein
MCLLSFTASAVAEPGVEDYHAAQSCLAIAVAGQTQSFLLTPSMNHCRSNPTIRLPL